MASATDDRSLLELLASLGTDVPDLVSKEIALVRLEARRVLARTQSAAALLVLATAFAIGTVSVLLLATVSAVATLLVSLGFSLPAAVSLAALAVGLAGTAMVAVLVFLARLSLRQAGAAIGGSVGVLRSDNGIGQEKVR